MLTNLALTKPIPVNLSKSNTGYRTRIESLTALRFITAAFLIYYHSNESYMLSSTKMDDACFAPAVTFFFVLSGFILTHNYFNISSWKESLSFYFARIARIWPAHAFTLLALVLLLPEVFKIKLKTLAMFISNLCLIHSWSGCWQYYFSYNSPSWSNSTDFFFYLAFPLLLLLMKRNWYLPILLSCASLSVMCIICALGKIPEANSTGISTQGLIYIHPLSRIVEFSVGMITALFAHKYLFARNLNKLPVTVIEIVAFYLVFLAAINCSTWRLNILPYIGNALSLWFQSGGFHLIGFVTLILAIATQKGFIASLLKHSFCILLGEISFAMYMLHSVLLTWHGVNFPQDNSIMSYCLFWLVTLVGSFLLWRLVETPSRKFLIKIGNVALPKNTAKEPLQKSQNTLFTSFQNLRQNLFSTNGLLQYKKEAFALILFGFLVWLWIPGIQPLSKVEALEATSTMPVQNIHLKYRDCSGARAQRQGNTIQVKFIWKETKDDNANYKIILQAVDNDQHVLGFISYHENPRQAIIPAYTSWSNDVTVSVVDSSKVKQIRAFVFRHNKELLTSGLGSWIVIPVNK